MNRKMAVSVILFVTLLALVMLTANYFPAGFGRPVPPPAHAPPAGNPVGQAPGPEPVQAHYAPGEVTSRCDAAIASANTTLDAIAATPQDKRTTGTTLLAFEQAMADFSDRTMPLTMTSYVYPDPGVSAEGSACEQKVAAFSVGVYARRDLYDAVRNATPRNADEARLSTMTLRQFIKNGLALPDDRLAKVRAAKEQLTVLENQFSTNLNNDNTTLEYTGSELAGVPAEALATFKKTGAGTYIVTTKYPDYYAVMQNAAGGDTRKRMYFAFVNRQADANTKLLEDAIVLRQQIATELGYATWADYRLDGRMAQTKGNVIDFLASLKAPLRAKTQDELAELLIVKKGIEPGATELFPWDVMYLNEQLRVQKYVIDSEKVREYFPLDRVTKGMFDQYGPLLGIRFVEQSNASVWAPGVRLYRIENATGSTTIAYMYLDLFPRDGKYGHTMMYPITGGRELNGTYAVPVAAIIGNMRAPNGDVPSLLTHDDVDGLFHEFGHVLHHSLTRAPYASLSGTNVEWDFVESPSQALEEWIWQPQVIEAISGHYKTGEKMPADMVQKIIAARDMDTGITYSRQLMIASEDMTFHTANGPVDVTKVSNSMYADIMGLQPIEGGHEPATIGHFMGGYDAGYYSYLWSKVYALNIFDKFERDGLTNATTGAEYRRWILERGNMEDGTVLLRGFLGKDPSVDVFYERLHINATRGKA